MMGPRRIAVAAFAALLVTAPGARADDFCVGEQAPCLPTLEDALDAARAHAGPDRVLVPAGEHEAPAGPADGPGEPVEVAGAGTATRIVAAAGATATLRLADSASRATALTIAAPTGPGATESLLLAGIGSRLVVSAPAAAGTPAVRMLAGARLSDTLADGPVTAVAPARVERSELVPGTGVALTADGGLGSVVVENTEIRLGDGATALEARCAGLVARHLTIVGPGALGIDAACADAKLVDLRNSVVGDDLDDLAVTTGGARIESRYSAHPADEDVSATDRLELTDPGFTSEDDLRPREGSPLVDAGEPGPLTAGEGFWDRGSRSRVTDGDGNGELRRDVGAHELQPPPVPVPGGNVLFNPGAEQGGAVLTAEEGPEPPGWTRTGAFTQVAYGATTRTAQGADIGLPSRETGAALGAGSAFFAAGPGESSRLVQRIDIAASAREIDAGVGSAALSGLLGGYGADEDEVRVTATFRDPEGNPLASLALGPVAAAERGGATNLLHREAAGAIPPRTRAIDVEIAGARVSAPGSAEVYADGYADNLALVLSVPGVPVQGPVDPDTMPPVKNLRPFSGITVLTGRPRLSSTGRTRVGIACASATVGRCSGTLELRAQLRRGLAFTRIAQFARFSLAPGRNANVTIKLTMAARRALRRAKSFRATLRAVARDGQGLERKTTIPIRVVRSAPSRRR